MGCCHWAWTLMVWSDWLVAQRKEAGSKNLFSDWLGEQAGA